ncbi:hypothetical protein CGSSp23BS72_04115, partial [Streptococcus pneumoniae SP23-BS72]
FEEAFKLSDIKLVLEERHPLKS